MPGDLARSMAAPLSDWIAQGPRTHVLKAVDPHTDELLGWVCWRRSDETKMPPRPAATGGDGAPQVVPALSQGTDAPHSTVDELEHLTDSDRERWQREIMPPGTACWYIVAIAVAPRAQSRGIGAALISWGTTRADAEGLFCWVHGSEAGRRAFEKAGFTEDDHLTVDLDTYAAAPPGSETGLQRWGEYTFTYMRREPASTLHRNREAESG
ncbi:GNAT family N-acetyltransferase [Frondihabitans cladoniiphilus]|uniref:GNAT family N-acetyltransferase n=1 Tax=Frondihabitans cladoniiphilus TaxID=715785 RepID=UPI0031E85DD2